MGALRREPFGGASLDTDNLLLKVHLALVQARTEWDILSALRLCADVNTFLSLIYLDMNDAGELVQGREVARVQGTLSWEPATPSCMNIGAGSPLMKELAERREPIWFLSCALSPLRVLPLSSDVKRLVALKLYGAAHVDQEPRWHALLLLTWPEPRDFDTQEKYLYTSLWETLSVVVSNHRLRVEALDMLRRLRELDRLKDEFLHMLSHELRTPVAAIVTGTDLMLSGIDGEIDERARRNVESIAQSGEHLLGIVNDLLDMASLEAGELTLHQEAVDLASVCQEAAQHVGAMAQEKGLQVQVQASDDLPPVRCDRRRVVQVLLNLLSNAIKFSDNGGIRVTAQRAAHEVVLSVQDEGPGIHPDHHVFIFERFRQVDGSLSRRGEGTGLGLPIAKHLVELHGGRISLKSSPGAGSCFSFSLPYEGRP